MGLVTYDRRGYQGSRPAGGPAAADLARHIDDLLGWPPSRPGTPRGERGRPQRGGRRRHRGRPGRADPLRLDRGLRAPDAVARVPPGRPRRRRPRASRPAAGRPCPRTRRRRPSTSSAAWWATPPGTACPSRCAGSDGPTGRPWWPTSSRCAARRPFDPTALGRAGRVRPVRLAARVPPPPDGGLAGRPRGRGQRCWRSTGPATGPTCRTPMPSPRWSATLSASVGTTDEGARQRRPRAHCRGALADASAPRATTSCASCARQPHGPSPRHRRHPGPARPGDPPLGRDTAMGPVGRGHRPAALAAGRALRRRGPPGRGRHRRPAVVGARRQQILSSRVGPTRLLAEAMAGLDPGPRCW